MFLFPQAKKQKNKPAPGDFWECNVSIATLTRRIHCKNDNFSSQIWTRLHSVWYNYSSSLTQ